MLHYLLASIRLRLIRIDSYIFRSVESIRTPDERPFSISSCQSLRSSGAATNPDESTPNVILPHATGHDAESKPPYSFLRMDGTTSGCLSPAAGHAAPDLPAKQQPIHLVNRRQT